METNIEENDPDSGHNRVGGRGFVGFPLSVLFLLECRREGVDVLCPYELVDVPSNQAPMKPHPS